MSLPLMPKATAVWLVDNTSLTFAQIAEFCGMHSLEIQAIADGGSSMMGLNPVTNGQLTKEEIARCEADETAVLKRTEPEASDLTPRKGANAAKSQDKASAIAWLLKHRSDLTDEQIRKLLGTTSSAITSIRNKTHKNMANIKARNPVSLGLCSKAELERAVAVAPKSLKKTVAPAFDVEDADEE